MTHQLPEMLRSDLRFFAFFVGNNTLCYSAPDAGAWRYDAWLEQPGPLLGRIFAIYISNYLHQDSGNPAKRAAQYLASVCVADYVLEPALAPWELGADHVAGSAAAAIINFTDQLGRGQLAPGLLTSTNYWAALFEFGSVLEQIMAIFINVLLLDDHERVINDDWAQTRAAQYIRSYCDSTYTITPPLDDWETELL